LALLPAVGYLILTALLEKVEGIVGLYGGGSGLASMIRVTITQTVKDAVLWR
jgi:hypothetical protein